MFYLRVVYRNIHAMPSFWRIIDDMDRAHRWLKVDMVDQGKVPKTHLTRELGHQAGECSTVLDCRGDRAEFLNLAKPDHYGPSEIRGARPC